MDRGFHALSDQHHRSLLPDEQFNFLANAMHEEPPAGARRSGSASQGRENAVPLSRDPAGTVSALLTPR